MRKVGCFCTVAGIMLRTKDFAVVSDKVKLPAASDAEFYIARAALPPLKTIYHPPTPNRSSGVILSGLASRETYQPELLERLQFKSSPLSAAWDALENKFGKNVIKGGWK